MLIEFSVRNFRSFRDQTRLSLVASKDRTRGDDNSTRTPIRGLDLIVNSAAIYGPNAGGKSNLLRSLMLMRGVVVGSAALQPHQEFNVQPFRLDRESVDAPTEFEIQVLIDGVRYQYGFELTPRRIVSEWLYVYETSKAQKWFERSINESTGETNFEFGSMFAGAKRIWQEATRPNALFLSTAIQLNSDSLAPLYAWFANNLHVLPDGGQPSHEFSTERIQSDLGRTEIVAFLRAADIGISSVSAKPVKGLINRVVFDASTGQATTNALDTELLMPEFTHRNGEISIAFGLEDESQGTQKLYALAGPVLDVLENGQTLVIDELDRSLHPLLCRQIIDAFHDPKRNRLGAQLIFTTHDTSLLDTANFRRDQIWFAEKGADQASSLTPLSDFSPRAKEALEKGYLGGRYGGVPILSPLFTDVAGLKRD
jgi:AAA15 family ATPase/GTPase